MAVKTIFSSCSYDQGASGIEKVGSQYKINKIGKLPSIVSESSGISLASDSISYWTHNDSGGGPTLYHISAKGLLIGTKHFPEFQNKDWEDLAAAPDGRVFIGDMGNNGNSRKDLSIYILNNINVDSTTTDKLTFSYPDQKHFPPPPNDQNYDCEAFFFFNEQLYLFSKNRSKTKKYTKLYTLKAEKGEQVAVLKDSLKLDVQVTSADISPDGKTFVILTYGKILFFKVENKSVNFDKPIGCMKFVRKQSEAISFINNHDLVVTNEQGALFKVTYK